MLRFRYQGLFRRVVTLSFLLFFVVGCAKKKPHQKESSQLAPSISPGSEVAALFPHPDGWEGGGSHGIWVNQRGEEGCLSCHRIDPTTPTSPATACHSCHPLYPHQENWVLKENHGASVLSQGKNSCATLCHGSDLQGGLSRISCNQCHTIYPHAFNWSEGGSHGVSAKGDGKLLCRICHGEDYRGGRGKVSCYQCHEQYPHVTEWSSPAKHGSFVTENGKTGCATGCHGTDLTGGLSQVSCTQCHQLYPHSEKWEEEHRRVVMEVGKNACARCHGDDFKKVLGGKNCYSCHADYPHPPMENWIPYQGGHGEKVQLDHDGKTDTCQKCHGLDLSRRILQQNCSSCHSSYPMAHQQENWNRYEGHGAVTPSVYPYSECQLCHGANYQGLRGNSPCSECHNRFPHLPGWRRGRGEPQDHGEFVRNNSNAGCATSRCHGENLVPSEVTRGANCRRCHEGYPHQDMESWRRPTGHGADVLSNGLADSQGNPRCLQCHDRERGGTYGARSCQNAACHSSYPHEMMENWEEEHGREAVGREIRNRLCGGCHRSDFRRVLGGVNCYSCHTNSPHTEDPTGGGCPLDGEGEPRCWTQTWITEEEVCSESEEDWPVCWLVETEHISPHASQYLDQQSDDFAPPDPDNPQAFNQCSRCHGTDYAGGASGVACSSCHPGYPHRAQTEWRTENGGTHTQAYLDGTRGTNSPCALCHRQLRTGLNSFATSCGSASCHRDLPDHYAPNWAAHGRSSMHGSMVLFSEAVQQRCATCHGDDFDRPIPTPTGEETSCRSCHERGIAFHVPYSDWIDRDHGAYFSGRFTSLSTDNNCQECHRPFTAFTQDQTRSALLGQSGCYRCHWAYPHTSFDQIIRDPVTGAETRRDEYPWEPVNTANCGLRNTTNSTGHVLYLLQSPLFTNASGGFPEGLGMPWLGDPAGVPWIDAINHTCGGEAGGCHSGGNRSYRTGTRTVLCGSVCHSSSRPYPPELPDCDPPPADQTAAGPPSVDSTTTTPTNDAPAVALTQVISVSFSEAMLRGTIAPSGALILEKVSDRSRIEGRVTCSSDWCRTATFTPSSPLAASTGYRGRVTTDARDWGGTSLASEYSWSFTTLTPDTTRPAIVSTSPTNGATDVWPTQITVNFSEPTSRSSVESSGVITLRRRTGSRTIVSGTARCQTSSCQTVNFTIRGSLREDTEYEARVTTDAQDLAGNRLLGDYVWFFTTGGL